MNLTQINELMPMLNVIRNQNEAINATRARQFLIVGVDDNGDYSMSSSPRPHSNSSEARTECRRLAKTHPGKLFIFVQLCGAEMVPNSAVSV